MACHGAADDNAQCAAWAAIGECAANSRYMLVSCRRACCLAPPAGPTRRSALPPELDLYKLGRLNHRDVVSYSRNNSNCVLHTEVPSLIEDVGTGHHTAALLWAHHLAHLARSPVTVFFTTRCSLLHGSLDVIRTTVEYDSVSWNKVVLRSPPEVALTLHRCRGGAAHRELEWGAHASTLVSNRSLSSNLKTVGAPSFISVIGSGW